MKDKFPPNKSHFKLIVSDFDGTLAGADHVTTSKVRSAVKAWIEHGKHFSIATGRQYLMIVDECKKMQLKDPVVVRGGAEVVDPISDKVLHSENISKDDVSVLVNEINASGLFVYAIEKDDVFFLNYKMALNFPKITYRSLDEFMLESIPKIHLKPIGSDIAKANQFLEDLAIKVPRINVIATHNIKFREGWDITSVKATKLHGIAKIIEQLGIARDEVVGVGDSYNDFPLLEAAGFKVAMGNAHQELKEIADVTVPSHEEDGVAYLIDQLMQ